MELVVDTNVLISALVRASATRILLLDSRLGLFSHELVLDELLEHKDIILTKSGLDETDFRKLTAILLSRISIVPADVFASYLRDAYKISPDPEDTPFIALCMQRRIPLWSNDSLLKKQNSVKVISTKELLELLK